MGIGNWELGMILTDSLKKSQIPDFFYRFVELIMALQSRSRGSDVSAIAATFWRNMPKKSVFSQLLYMCAHFPILK
ncbi:MAG: hypothetical protein F6K47_35470 [Symploca sp. SIO2E6]|nr:hypothetical protein [Symploca sp. SIO2E6]